jgi:hypothetical protein
MTMNAGIDAAGLEPEPDRSQLLAHIARLEDALGMVQRWSLETATDLTPAGYDRWAQLVPYKPRSDLEIEPPLLAQTKYKLTPEVNERLRSAIDCGAFLIQTLVVSFHPRRGQLGLRRDLARAKLIAQRLYRDVQRAEMAVDESPDTRVTQ